MIPQLIPGIDATHQAFRIVQLREENWLERVECLKDVSELVGMKGS